MEVGTIKTGIKGGGRKRRRVRYGGTGGGTGGTGGGGSGGDDFNNHDFLPVPEEQMPNKSRILTWFLLLIVLMTFGGVIGAYIVIATNGVLEWKPFNLPVQVWISTALILASSATYSFAQRAVNSNDHQKTKNFLLATTVLGGMFISSQILAWFALVQRGVYMQSNPYAGFFYILTALHAVHVIGGIVALGYLVLRTWQPSEAEAEVGKRREIASAVGWYWHFMDGLWIVLLVLLGFWK